MTRLGIMMLAVLATAADAAAPERAPAPVPRPSATAITVPDGLGTVGWMLWDLDRQVVVAERASDRPFAPASVAKLPTAAYALETLGPDHVFETRLVGPAPDRFFQVPGDVYLVGGGDPELDTGDLLGLIDDLDARGITAVKGRVLGDGSLFPAVPDIEPTQPVEVGYNPSVSGLNLNFNRVHLKWNARRKPLTSEVVSEAHALTLPVTNVAVDLTERDAEPPFLYTPTETRERWDVPRALLRGEAARWLPAKRPDILAAEVLHRTAETRGIASAGFATGTAPDGARTLASVTSRPLFDILRYMLKFSTNLSAEAVGLAASRARGPAPQTLAASGAEMGRWAAARIGAPEDDPEFQFPNHSGLTLEARVSPRRMVQLLASLDRSEPRDTAVSTVLNRYNIAARKDPPSILRAEVRAKTGTMNYVRGLAGYLTSATGRRFAFAVFINDLDRRAGPADRVNKRWLRAVTRFERGLLRRWTVAADRS